MLKNKNKKSSFLSVRLPRFVRLDSEAKRAGEARQEWHTLYSRFQRGFTLAEMLVALLVFSIIMGVATGLFVSAMRNQRYSLAYQQILNQTSYAMEYMSRAIRMAKKNDEIICSGMATKNYDGTDGLIFATYHGECWKFSRDTSAEGYGRLRIDKNGTLYDLTSDDLDITSLNFSVFGDEVDGSGNPTDNFQPRVTIFMEARGRGEGSQPTIKIQTTVSQRNLDF